MDLTDFQHLEWEEQVLYFIPDMRFVLLDYVQLTRRGHHIVNNHEFFTGELKPLKGYGMVYEIHAENTMMYTSTSCVCVREWRSVIRDGEANDGFDPHAMIDFGFEKSQTWIAVHVKSYAILEKQDSSCLFLLLPRTALWHPVTFLTKVMVNACRTPVKFRASSNLRDGHCMS